MFDQLAEHLDGLGAAARTTTVAANSIGSSSMPLTSAPSVNLLSKWFWVDTNTIESIANNKFDINHLPKLHRQEEFRNRHVKATAEGVYQPFDKSKPAEIVVGQTKMHRTFKDPATFFSAWQVYVSIRTAFSPEQGPGLALFAERIYYHIQLNYPWPAIFNYILEFFRKHQNSPPEAWYDVDGTLVANHLAVCHQKYPSSNPSMGQHAVSQPMTSTYPQPLNQQVCHNWNRESGCTFKETRGTDCLRRHVCSICSDDGHRAFQCQST